MKICMLAYSFYEIDNRVRRYAEALVRRGDVVDVIALRRKHQSAYSEINGVRIHRIQARIVNEKKKITYLYRLLLFLIKSSWFLTHQHLASPYSLIHVHSPPDFEVFAGFIAKLLGAKTILDIHDLVPEFYSSKFAVCKNSPVSRGLILVERVSNAFSDHVIISNHIWYEKLISRSINQEKCTVILNYPDNRFFYKKKSTRKSDNFTMIYPGSINWHQGVDIAIKAFERIKDKVPEAQFLIYGDGPERNNLINLIEEYNLEERVILRGNVSSDDMASIMSRADIGIVPKRDDSFGGEAFSTKTLEFMSLGVPVIVSKTKIDKYYFDESIVKYFNPGDEKDLAEAMLLLIKDKSLRELLAKNALKFIEQYQWEHKKLIYLDIVDSLVGLQDAQT